MMKIEAGKYYKTRDGRKVGPMVHWKPDGQWPWSDHKTSGSDIWKDDGGACDKANTLVAEWTDAPDLSNPLGQVFGLMPPETQEAMKAHGGPWELFVAEWKDCPRPAWLEGQAYRVKPAPIRETVTLIGNVNSGFDYSGWTTNTHRIQFDLIDGKPDCASIKMEPLE
jgi:hypothetical protein